MSLAVHLKNGIVLHSPLIGAAQLAELSTTFGPVQNIDFTFSAPNEVPGARGSLAQLTTPLSGGARDRKSTRLNSSHANISYAVFCLKKKKKTKTKSK